MRSTAIENSDLVYFWAADGNYQAKQSWLISYISHTIKDSLIQSK